MTDSVLVVHDTAVTVLASGQQGPAGPPGPPGLAGSAGASYSILTAGAALGGNRVVIDNATYADNSNDAHINKVIGFTVGAATLGAPVNIQSSGELDGFSGLAIAPVYLAANGTLTQDVPTSGFIQKLGNAISSTAVLIAISPPLKLT